MGDDVRNLSRLARYSFDLEITEICGYYSVSNNQPWYRDLSHIEVIISHEANLDGKYKTEVWDKSHIPWLVVG